jgi:hypothetical protein
MITLHCGSSTYNILVDDTSYRYRALMAKPQLILKFSLSEYIDIPVGAWCMYQNEKFVLRAASNLKKSGTRNITYDMTLGQDEDNLGLYKMRNSVDGRLKYSMCAKPHELIEEIVKNLNNRAGSGVWSVGTCIDANEKTIEFNHVYIDDALQSVADLFETEWEIVNHVISLHKVEYFKDDPLPLSYGKGNGFVPGIGRTTQSDEMPIKRLYTQGGERNIDRSKYGSPELLLPKGQTLEYEGRTYKSDAQGYYIERIDKISDAVKEDSLDCSDIYPSREGTVSGVEVIDADNNFYDFIDNSIPSNLNFNDYIIAGETPTIVFQSGMLAGDDKQFEFKYKHAERRFELVPQEIDGVTMPNESYKPAVGDTYAVFGIMLPESYICNNLTKEGASWDMFREAARKLYENEDQKFTFNGELQGLWAKRNWLNVGGYMKVGAYILFSDEQFAKEGVSIRITGIKDYVNSPYSPSLEISNSVSGKSLSSQLKEIDNQEVVINDTKKGILQFTKRRFRDALETIEMLNDSLLDFSVAVNPVAVQTMAALIGDESLQFRFVNSKSNLTPVTYNITYDNTIKQLHCPHGFLQHMTLGITSISSSHGASEYKVWEISEYLSPVLTAADSKYYLYAKVSRNDTNAKGTFVLSETAIAMDDVDGYYHLLVGVLNSESNGERSYVDLYGFTEILPGRITTDRIVSSDGISFIDLLNNAVHIGDDKSYIDWNNLVSQVLSLKNVSIETVNSNGTIMYSFSGIDGSGQLAKGNIVWDKSGNVKMQNLSLQGSLRNPFVRETDSIDIVIGGDSVPSTHDNVVPIAVGGGWITAGSLEWSKEQSGRRMCIANYRWGSDITDGMIQYDAPTGKYFYENGVGKESLKVSRECVELMGYGTKDEFYGWIVLNRTDLMTANCYGKEIKALAMGVVTGTNSGASINYKTFDRSTMSVERLAEGRYKITFDSHWFNSASNVLVMATGLGYAVNSSSSPIKPTVTERGTTYAIIDISDDSSRNDGSFIFFIHNMNDWLYQ